MKNPTWLIRETNGFGCFRQIAAHVGGMTRAWLLHPQFTSVSTGVVFTELLWPASCLTGEEQTNDVRKGGLRLNHNLI